MKKNVNISEVLDFILSYRLSLEQLKKVQNSKNKESLIYDFILKDTKQRFGVDFSENFEICYNITEMADLCAMEVA